MVERDMLRVEAAAAARHAAPAPAACVVATLGTSPQAVRWERNLRGVALQNSARTMLEPTLAELREDVVVAARPAVVGRCGVDTVCPKQQVPGMTTLF
jgi:hypothetical protein